MPSLEFAIDLTVPDNTAFTVLTALRSMGYNSLTRVERAHVLRLGFADGARSPDECGRALKAAEVVFNPNKHRIAYADGGSSGHAEAVVADKDDDTDSLKALLAEHFGIQGLESVERATAWRLFEGDAPASAQQLEWACSKLLANAHSQSHVVRQRPSYRPI